MCSAVCAWAGPRRIQEDTLQLPHLQRDFSPHECVAKLRRRAIHLPQPKRVLRRLERTLQICSLPSRSNRAALEPPPQTKSRDRRRRDGRSATCVRATGTPTQSDRRRDAPAPPPVMGRRPPAASYRPPFAAVIRACPEVTGTNSLRGWGFVGHAVVSRKIKGGLINCSSTGAR